MAREPPPLPTTNEALQELLAQINGGDDRTCAIVASAFLDDLLRNLLYTRFLFSITAKHIELDVRSDDSAYDAIADTIEDLLIRENGLGTFKSRIDMCLALGMIPTRMHRDLEFMRSIRNRFAHWSIADDGKGKGKLVRLSFDEQKIQSWCRAMRPPPNCASTEPRPKFIAVFMRMAGLIIGDTSTMRLGLDGPHKQLYLGHFPIGY